MNITFRQSEKGTEFFLDGKHVGSALSVPGSVDCFLQEEEDVYQWERTAQTAVSSMEMSFVSAYHMEYQMIPALMYNQNRSDDPGGGRPGRII